MARITVERLRIGDSVRRGRRHIGQVHALWASETRVDVHFVDGTARQYRRGDRVELIGPGVVIPLRRPI